MARVDGEIKINDMADFNLTVSFTRRFFFRQWIALKLIGLATWVMRCGVTWEEIDEEDSN